MKLYNRRSRLNNSILLARLHRLKHRTWWTWWHYRRKRRTSLWPPGRWRSLHYSSNHPLRSKKSIYPYRIRVLGLPVRTMSLQTVVRSKPPLLTRKTRLMPWPLLLPADLDDRSRQLSTCYFSCIIFTSLSLTSPPFANPRYTIHLFPFTFSS